MNPRHLLLPGLLLVGGLAGGCYLEDPDGCTDCSPTEVPYGSLDSDDDSDGFTEDQGDCNDIRSDIYPGAEELPDGRDNDCDGQIDEGIDAPTPTSPGSTPTPTSSGSTPTPTSPPSTPTPVEDTPTATPTAAPTPTPTPTAFPDSQPLEPDSVLGPVDRSDSTVLSDLKWIGDFDNDGYDDFAASMQSGGEGRVFIYYGGPDGSRPDTQLDGAADAILTGLAAPDTNGVRLGVGGDVNGDGFDDLILGDIYQRRASVYLGGPRLAGEIGSDGAAVVFYSFLEGSYGLGLGLDIVPDMDGDGMDEIAIGIPAYDFGKGMTALFYGRELLSGNVDIATADLRLVGEVAEAGSGSQVFGLGDIDKDGTGDLGILSGTLPHGPDTAVTRGTFSILYGNTSRTSGSLAMGALPTLFAPVSSSFVGMEVSVGDHNGDENVDLLFGVPNNGTGTGTAWLLYGDGARVLGDVYLDTVATRIRGEGELDAAFGASVAMSGDITGNNMADIVIASPARRSQPPSDIPGQVPSPDDYASAPGYAAIIQGNNRALDWSVSEHAWGMVEAGDLGQDVLWPVATGGDFNGDGRADLLIGASELSEDGQAFASVLLFY